MANWRKTTSVECQQDLDSLLDACIDIAAERISANWGLDPVAVVNATSGERRVLMAAQSETDQYSSSDTPIRDRLVADLRATSDDVRSYAVVSNVTVEGASGTHLEVLLEHREYAMQIVVPYLMPDEATFDLGPMKASVGQRLVWG